MRIYLWLPGDLCTRKGNAKRSQGPSETSCGRGRWVALAAWLVYQGAQGAAPLLNPVISGGGFGLEWPSETNVLYRLQSSTDLGRGDWVTEDLVGGSGSISIRVRWMAPESLSSSKFYRIALPEPEIMDVQPAWAVTGSPVDVYIIGQGFSPDDILRVGSTILSNRVVLSSTLMRVTFTPDVAGTYGFELETASGKKSSYSYSWTVVSTPAGSQARLEPPVLPPAAPVRLTIKQKNVEHPVGDMRDYEKEPAHVEIPNLCAFSGELQSSAVDLFVRGRGLDFVWTRTYRSSTGSATAMGNGWDFSYNLWVQRLGGDILIHSGTGRDDRLFQQTNGTFVADGFFSEGTLSNNVFRLTFADSGFWEFLPFDGSAAAGKISRSVDRNGNTMTFGYDPSGRLTTIVDDLGRTNTVAYDQNGLVRSVTDFSGRTVTYGHYGGGGAGGSIGDLATVTTPPVVNTPNGNDFPAGKTTTFTYTAGNSDDRLNHNLSSITDAASQTWLQVVYTTNTNPADLDFDAVDYLQRGPNRIKLRRYTQAASPANQYATVKAVINDGAGNVSECFYDVRNRCVRQLDYTGRANPDLPTTETSNRPKGKLRAGDPDYFETRWEWNPDSLCTRVTLPGGETIDAIYERAFNQNSSRSNRRQAGNLRVLHDTACCGGADTDGDGFPDLSLRSWYFDYDPRFGAPITECRVRVEDLESSLKNLGLLGRKGWDGTIKGRFAAGPRQTTSLDGSYGPSRPGSRKGWDGTIKGRIVLEEPAGGTVRKWEDDVIDFAVRVTDPRRATFKAAYDAHGNCVEMFAADYMNNPQNSPRSTVAYNIYGQVTAITNAPDANGYRRVDLAQYYTNGPQAGYCAIWIVDAQGPIVTLAQFEHDPRGNLTRCVDPRGNDTLWTYNALDQCVRCESPTNLTARCAADFWYDANDNLVRKTMELRDEADVQLGTRSDFWSYSLLDLCTSHAQQVSATHFVTNTFVYDPNDNLALASFPEAVNGNDPTNVIVFSYDERDLVLQCTRAPGAPSTAVTEYAYDPAGRCVSIVVRDAFGNAPPAARSFAYDGFGRCVAVTDPMGNTSVRAYDAGDNLLYERRDGELNDVDGGALNRRLAETRYEYDLLGRCLRSRQGFFDPASQLALSDGESTTVLGYAPNGQLTSVTDDNLHVSRFGYDTIGRLSVVTDPKADTLSYSYDPSGNPLTAIRRENSDVGAAQTLATYNAFDSLNRCVASSDSAGNTNRYFYDSFGRCTRSLDAAGNLSGRSYDLLWRCTLAVADLDGDGQLDFARDAGRTWAYDDNSRCTVSTDANGNTTSYSYDSLDRCTAVTSADGTTCRLVWSPRSNLAGEQDANGTVINSTFDLLDRCVRRNIAPGPGVAATTTFEVFGYDGCSRLVVASNDVSACSFAFDSLSDCVATVQDGLSTTCAFDGVGNPLSLTYPSGRIVVRGYDSLDQLTSLSTAAGGGLPVSVLAQYAYDGPGRLARITRANNISTRIVWNGLASSPNGQGDFGWSQVAGVNHQVAGGGAVVDRRSYAYDHNQNKVVRAQLTPWILGGPTETNVFGYDALGRLRLAINSRGTSVRRNDYGLDAQGNRLAVIHDGSIENYSRDNALPEPGDFQMDQYTVTPFGTQQYDANGNLLARAGAAGFTQYHYDYADRLVEVDGMGSGGTITALSTFAYDALGRRVSRTVYPPAPLAPVTTWYIHGGGQTDADCGGPLLEERLGSPAGPVSRAYCRAGWGTAAGDLDRDAWPDVVAFNAAGQTQFYHCDELGNVLALTDAKGAVLERYSYDDFGQPAFLTSDGVPLVDGNGLPVRESPQGNPLLFHGMSWDGLAALYCREFSPAKEQMETKPRNRVAFVDPVTGRYVTRSGIPLRYGRNGFTFSGENPWSAGGIAIDESGVHRAGVIHRDLATRNILLAGRATAKISDFGMSRFRQEFGQVLPTRHTTATFQQSSRFSIEIDGVMVGGIHCVEGIEHETDVVEYKDGEDGTMHTRPGNHKPGKMTVTKDWSNTSEWYKWRKAVLDGKVDRKSISVIFHNDAGEEAGRMNFHECWPTKWVGPNLNARNSGHAIEKLEISWETMELK